MNRFRYLLFALLWLPTLLGAQQDEGIDIKVYGFEEGLTHRNVFKIQQDQQGFIWIATVNGLNKFDGHDFLHYTGHSEKYRLPFEYISDLAIAPDSMIWMVNPNYVTVLNPQTNETRVVRAEAKSVLYEQPRTFHNLIFSPIDQQVTLTAYLNETGASHIEQVKSDSILEDYLPSEGLYAKRAIIWRDDHLFVSHQENTIREYDRAGNMLRDYTFPNYFKGAPSIAWVDYMQVTDDQTLWVLLNNGQVYYLPKQESDFKQHPITDSIYNRGVASALLVEENGDVWVAGLANLWHYQAGNGTTSNYDERIRDILKNNCTYRQIFKDDSGVIWIASDFGAIKMVRSDKIFTQYLSEGSEYCSNGFCSMRGITEDEQGNLYFSYYNSIHRLDQQTNVASPLFPLNDYFNFPFGLLYHQNALYTGNGRRIDLATLKVDTLFNHSLLDLGHCMVDQDGLMWFAYRQWLYQYQPENGTIEQYPLPVDTTGTNYSFIYQGKADQTIWLGTLEKGLYKLDKEKGLIGHYQNSPDSSPQLKHNKINGIHEDTSGNLWLATGNGLHRWNLATDELQVFDNKQGLANNFINGLLSEGDSAIWVSTDNGLSRFDVSLASFINFSKFDGLTANEFNRVSCYQAKNGRMYFGGLNGINAFMPSEKLGERRQLFTNKILFTGFSKLDGRYDSIISKKTGLSAEQPIELAFQDKFFSFEFALANYRNPAINTYSYKLEGYEDQWSEPSLVHSARFNGIPPGNYTFRVRAATAEGSWNKEELTIEVWVKEAFYKSWWFIILSFLSILGIVFGVLEYQLYRSKKRQKELEHEVSIRTQELERAMRKSDELLLNILPAETAEELKKFGKAKAKRYDEVTVLFTDVKDFTNIAEQLEPEELVAEIDYCFRNFDAIIEKYGIEKIKTIGDAYMCAGGLPQDDPENPIKVVKAAIEIRDFMVRLAAQRTREGRVFFEMRLGIHTGPVVAGIVGTKKFAYDIWGDAVNIAARLEDNSEVGKINISEITYNHVKEKGIHCTYRGKIAAKNKGEIDMYFVD